MPQSGKRPASERTHSSTSRRATPISFVGGTRMSRKRSVWCGVRETRQPKPPSIAPTLTIAFAPRYAFAGSFSHVGIHSSTASSTSCARRIEFCPRLPSLHAVWMKLPWTRIRRQRPHRLDVTRERALHVRDAEAVEPPVANERLRLEPRHVAQPGLPPRVRRVHVPVEHQRLATPRAGPCPERVRPAVLHLLPLH